jgi:hypothetical protein
MWPVTLIPTWIWSSWSIFAPHRIWTLVLMPGKVTSYRVKSFAFHVEMPRLAARSSAIRSPLVVG